ncbi:hypothetical protein GCM10022419_000290 [Nonomuraea rosea]|uniref:Uncharacterized protein n=1 Tax=Nonomuraea rosea TaxID=638574 RepID=A0ABP6UYV3_9ACTN
MSARPRRFDLVANKYPAPLADVERRTIGQYRKTLEDHFLHTTVTLTDGAATGMILPRSVLVPLAAAMRR